MPTSTNLNYAPPLLHRNASTNFQIESLVLKSAKKTLDLTTGNTNTDRPQIFPMAHLSYAKPMLAHYACPSVCDEIQVRVIGLDWVRRTISSGRVRNVLYSTTIQVERHKTDDQET